MAHDLIYKIEAIITNNQLIVFIESMVPRNFLKRIFFTKDGVEARERVETYYFNQCLEIIFSNDYKKSWSEN